MSFKGIVSVSLQGTSAVSRAIEKAVEARRKAAVDQLNLGAFAIHAWIVGDMNRPKSGQGYPRGATGLHIASAPGESPARDTGELVRKLRVSLAKVADTNPEAMVISAAEYAAALEFGTERIAARPYMRPAFAANSRKIYEAVRAALKG